MNELSQLVDEAQINIITCVIDKVRHRARYADPWNPYGVALHFCLKELFGFLRDNDQGGRLAHVICESRGAKEDRQLEEQFGNTCAGYGHARWPRLELRFAKKAINATGLQLADLTARPIALSVLRPEQRNRAYDIIHTKLQTKRVFP